MNSIRETEFDRFSLRIQFARNTPNPERIFIAMAGIIQAVHEIDVSLACCVSVNIVPEYLLEDVEAGSIKACLRSFLHSLDDEDLKSLAWKRLAGKFVVKGKYWLLKKLADDPKVLSSERLTYIANDIDLLARESNALEMQNYRPVSHYRLLNAISSLASARRALSETDTAEYHAGDDVVDISNIEVMSQEEYDNQQVELIHEDEYDVVLKIRKPDFIGNSQWGFLRDGKNVAISIIDIDWLNKFRAGEITLRPGDLMRVRIKEGVRKNRRTGEIDTIELIESVHDVYREPQVTLPLPIQK